MPLNPIPTLITFEIFGRAKNHDKKFSKLSQTPERNRPFGSQIRLAGGHDCDSLFLQCFLTGLYINIVF